MNIEIELYCPKCDEFLVFTGDTDKDGLDIYKCPDCGYKIHMFMDWGK